MQWDLTRFFPLQFDLRSDSATKLFTCYSFLNDRRRVRLNSIAIDPQNPYYFSIGGSDEYVRLYDMRRFQLDDSRNINQPVDTFCPKHLVKGGKVHITGIAYSYAREILVSYNDELVYLFQSNMGLCGTEDGDQRGGGEWEPIKISSEIQTVELYPKTTANPQT